MSSYNSENTSSCIGQQKRNVQEVRRYDTNMRHNRSSTEGSVGVGGGGEAVFFVFCFPCIYKRKEKVACFLADSESPMRFACLKPELGQQKSTRVKKNKTGNSVLHILR